MPRGKLQGVIEARMTQIFNRTTEKEKRRELRNNAPEAEALVWARLRNKQTGYRFRRQYSVGRFVVDFYCPSLKLAIELDGDSHVQEGAPAQDRERQAFIEALGISFLRFTNDEVFNNADGVVRAISKTAGEMGTPYGPPFDKLRAGSS